MTECVVSGCVRDSSRRKMCSAHYRRFMRGADLSKPLLRRQADACRVCGDPKVVARDYCSWHYSRWRTTGDMESPKRRDSTAGTLAERLSAYTPKGSADECWEWLGTRNKGYAWMCIGNGRQRNAHVVAWELANGRKLPKGMVVRHDCDNPPCVNPAHLRIGTHADNVADKVARGRSLKGSENPRAKLTLADVNGIRLMRETGYTQQLIADTFGVSQTNVSRILLGKTWSDF